MDSSWFNQWIIDRAESDDELDALIAVHICQVTGEDEGLHELIHVLNQTHGGSRIGRSPNLPRDHAAGHRRIYDDYFSRFAVYPASMFRRRFRMQKALFMRIHNAVLQADDYFVQKPDCIGNPGISSLQKQVAALRMLCYGSAGDAVDEYVRIGESTAISSFKHFVEAVVDCFGDEYLRHPSEDDVRINLEINRRRGFPGMFGSLDCTHWTWKNCPVGEQGQFRDKDGNMSIVLEAIATSNLWIWHAFAGIPGSCNDINVIDRSPLMVNLLNGVAPDVSYELNGNTYDMFYLLCDGIYPEYTIFMKPISDPQGAKLKWYSKRQESVRKDVERCFGVLQARFAMVRNPSKWWSRDQMILVWKAAVILHNMIVEDEEDDDALDHEFLFEASDTSWTYSNRPPLTSATLSHVVGHITDENRANQLKHDLIEHLWQLRGDEDE